MLKACKLRVWASAIGCALSLTLLTGPLASPASANAKYAGIVVDANTGRALYASSADARRYPASLTKVMTLYILFEEMERGRFTLDSRLKVSAYAAGQAPSKLGVRAGRTIRVRDAIKALAVKSANDVAVVVAEAVEGSEAAFARRMTRTARTLGMSNTTFRNANGLPNSGQVTTARDMARLGIAIQERFPRYYDFFSTRTYSWGGRTFTNTNRLLGAVKGVDGIKTGYTRASGFNLLTAVNSDGRRTVSVVMGGRTGRSRNAHMADLIKRYHHKASRGRRNSPLIAAAFVPPLPKARPVSRPRFAGVSGRPVQAETQAVTTESISPAPGRAATRDLIAARIDAAGLAYATTTKPRRNPLAQLPFGVRNQLPFGVRKKTAEAATATKAGGNEAPATAPDVVLSTKVQSPVPAQAFTSPAQPEAEIIPAGWHVQIGALPTKAGALALLEQAQAKAGDLLASADPFTQAIEKDGVRLYRARFAGFSGKEEARSVCRDLKRRSFACLAISR